MRYSRLSLFLLFVVPALLAGCHSRSSLTDQQAEGKHLYSVHCAHCHEENDVAFKPPPPDLHALFSRSTMPSGAPVSDAAVASVVLNGKGRMPAFVGRFTDEQTAALIAYLHTGLR